MKFYLRIPKAGFLIKDKKPYILVVIFFLKKNNKI